MVFMNIITKGVRALFRQSNQSVNLGLKVNCSNAALNAILFGNRAACEFRLENYRSAFKDCLYTRKLDENHFKCILRGAECLLKLKRPSDAVRWLTDWRRQNDNITDQKHNSGDVMQLLDKADSLAKLEQRDARKKKLASTKEKLYKDALVAALRERKINFDPPIDFDDDEFTCDALNVKVPQMQQVGRLSATNFQNCRVDFEDGDIASGVLVWPVLLRYPEHTQTDFVKELSEKAEVREIIEHVLHDSPQWDVDGRYRPAAVTVFWHRNDERGLQRVDTSLCLSDILSNSAYSVMNNLPVFDVVVKGSDFEKQYISSYRRAK